LLAFKRNRYRPELRCRRHNDRAPVCLDWVKGEKQKPRYESRVFDGRIIHSAEIERIHREVLDYERIEAISETMRELIEDLWPELVNKLPPKAN